MKTSMTCRWILIWIVLLYSQTALSQPGILSLLKDPIKEADLNFQQGNFRHALEIYLEEKAKPSATTALDLRIARCYYRLHQYTKSHQMFESYLRDQKDLSRPDLLLYAEVLYATGKYERAVQQYKLYLNLDPNNEEILRRIWRLENIQYLFEDSLHYSLRKMDINSGDSDFAAVPYDNGIVFVSRRKGARVFEKVDAVTGENTYKLFYAAVDPTATFPITYRKPVPFHRRLQAKFHNGSLMFYTDNTKAVLSMTSEVAARDGRRHLKISFAERGERDWAITSDLPFNNPEHSFSHPFITSDGLTLYFSSDMNGGFGGYDLYKSEYHDGKWTKPVNLGGGINTAFDETFPHFFKDTFYFASNGHPGMGGIDIFKVLVREGSFGEVDNPGFPVNSSFDDFGLFFSPHTGVGYLSSNRAESSEDDLYELEIDLQTYPVSINGILKSKKFTLSDSSVLSVLAGAKLSLIDHTREVVVAESVSDETGRFTLSIPYFSQYKIKVIEKDGAESTVSLEIPRQKKEDYNHEIVVVKNAFPTPDE